jgi:uncharacterized membrane protein YbhN (UPF0104 family)
MPHLLNLSKATKLRLKLLFSFLMIGSLFLFGKVDLHKSLEVAQKANLWFLALATILYLIAFVVNAQRWQLLARAVGISKPFGSMVQYCFVGNFFNLFLPSTVGGDFTRGYYLSKGTGRYLPAFYSVLADRAIGISILFLFASLGILLGPGGSGLPLMLKLPIFLGTVGIFGVLPLMPMLATRILGPDNLIAHKLNSPTAQVYWKDKGVISMALLLSVLMQVIVIICHIAVGFSLGLMHIPIWYYFVFYPSVAVLGFVTPSFNGIGIREWAYTYFLMMVGVDRSHALTFALVWLGLITFNGLTGGIVYLLGHFAPPPQNEEEIEVSALTEPDEPASDSSDQSPEIKLSTV